MPSLEINVNSQVCVRQGDQRTVSLPHIMVRILGMAKPTHQMQIQKIYEGQHTCPITTTRTLSRGVKRDQEYMSFTEVGDPIGSRWI